MNVGKIQAAVNPKNPAASVPAERCSQRTAAAPAGRVGMFRLL